MSNQLHWKVLNCSPKLLRKSCQYKTFAFFHSLRLSVETRTDRIVWSWFTYKKTLSSDKERCFLFIVWFWSMTRLFRRHHPVEWFHLYHTPIQFFLQFVEVHLHLLEEKCTTFILINSTFFYLLNSLHWLLVALLLVKKNVGSKPLDTGFLSPYHRGMELFDYEWWWYTWYFSNYNLSRCEMISLVYQINPMNQFSI